MDRFLRRALALCLAALPVSCGGGDEPEFPPVTPTRIDRAKTGSIQGHAVFRGAPPQNRPIVMGTPECKRLHADQPLDEKVLVRDGDLQNAFVFIRKGLDGIVYEHVRTPVTIDNRGCFYHPRVCGVRPYQPVTFLNSDPMLHNVQCGEAGFNKMLPGPGSAATVQFREPYRLNTLRCSIHTWMVGHVWTIPHPHFAVTAADGGFRIPDVPEGKYELEAWHEVLGTRAAAVHVTAGGTAVAEFDFTP